MPKPELLIVGDSPVARPSRNSAKMLGFKVTTDPSRINESTYVVVATMGNADEEGLLSVLGSKPKYFGLVASEKKSKAFSSMRVKKGTRMNRSD